MVFELFCPVYNEEIIIQHTIDFYKKVLREHGIIFNFYDNGSTDNTVDILKRNDCNVGTFNTNNEIRDDYLIKFKNNVWKGSKADFVIIIDCDEWVEINPNVLSNVTIVKSEGWDMIENNDLANLKYGVRHIPEDKTCVFSPKYIKEINYTIGSHDCNPEGLLMYPEKDFRLFHVKPYSLDYMIKKFEESKKRLSSINKENGWGNHYNMTIQEITDFHNLRITQRQEIL